MRENSNAFGVASLVCGCLAVVFFLLLINIPLVALAFIFGVLQLVSHKKKLFAVLGMSAALLSVCLMILGWTAIFYGTSSDPQFMEEFRRELIRQYQNQ